MRRHIKLAEYMPNCDMTGEPDAAYLQTCNSTLAQRPYRIRTDRFGFLATCRTDPPRDGYVVLLGDSLIENYWMAEDKRCAALVEDVLVEGGRDVRVLNGGVSGASTLDLLNVMLNKVLPLKPLSVFLMSGLYDLIHMSSRNSLWDLVETAVPETGGSFENLLRERTVLLNAFRSLTQASGIDLVLATWGFSKEAPQSQSIAAEGPRACEALGLMRRVNDHLRSFAASNAIPLVDLEAICEDDASIFYDGVHVNEVGSALYAQHIARALVQLRLRH